jgi:hypothetical protein
VRVRVKELEVILIDSCSCDAVLGLLPYKFRSWLDAYAQIQSCQRGQQLVLRSHASQPFTVLDVTSALSNVHLFYTQRAEE